MYKIATISDDERRIVFRNTAQKLGMHEVIIEKDFWVCLTLDYLFHRCKWKEAFTFKGGTSLSKCYGLIKRFSEDIDLILDWRVLGYEANEPWEERSNTKQDLFNKEANNRVEIFLKDELLPTVINDFSQILNDIPDIYIDDIDPQTICFKYKNIFSSESILQTIRLEIGSLAVWTPAIKKNVTPYVAECYPDIFDYKDSEILTVAAERTFWEKTTILHHEANRPDNLKMPKRYSRHYYDLYCIAHSDSKYSAYSNLELLNRVVEFKMKFYPRKWARYEDAKPGTLRLIPPEFRFSDLKDDYISMRDMMFGDYPEFEKLMEYILLLENEINNL